MPFRSVVVSLALAFVLAPVIPAHATYGEPAFLFRFQSNQITESSGFAQGRVDGDVYWTHNDSPNTALSGARDVPGRFFAVGPAGEAIGEFTIAGAIDVDWEDMATGPGTGGAPSLFFADVGDNNTMRGLVQVYEVPEPRVEPTTLPIRSLAGTIHLLQFEDGAHNVETFLVDPADGSFAIVTKDESGRSGLYLVDAAPSGPGVRTLRRVAEIRFDVLRTPGTPSGALLSTGGAIAPDRSRFVVRTYAEAFEWSLETATLAEAVTSPPLRIQLAPSNQGEAITYTSDSTSILTTTEGSFAPVHLIPGT